MRKLLFLFLKATLLMTMVVMAAPQVKSTGTKTPEERPGAKAPGTPAAAGLPAAATVAVKSIDPERIRAHVRFLAHDLLEGRGTGQRGGDIAAEYIATQFALYGLKPAGDNGTYMQKIPLAGITTLPETTFSIVPVQGQPMILKMADDYVATDRTQKESNDIDAEIVYVGYGIEAPEYKWDDYKGADLRGKTLLMLVNEPPSDDPKFFKGKALTYYGRWTYKFEEAARRGAVAVILVHKTDMASYGWSVVRNSWAGENSYLKAEGPQLKSAGWVQLDVARKMAAAAGKDLDQLMEQARSRDFRPIPLPLRLKAHMMSTIRRFDSNNVLAVLPGSDPRLKDEAVIYTAHYDHLGIHPEAPGDNIYNGANDNATGCGILLEIARAFSSAAQRPKRSILFASVTAEEQGLLGSLYLGQHPLVPANRIMLDLNYDNVRPVGTPEEVQVAGAERTTFYPVVQTTAQQFQLAMRPDPRPEDGHYYRSDHFSLARVGVPSFSVNQGDKFRGHPREWGAQGAKEFYSKHYHQPSDEYHPDMDFSADAVMARFGFALGWKAAAQPQAISWQPGDEFEAARKKSQESAGGTK